MHLLSREHGHGSGIPMGSGPSKRKETVLTSIWMPGVTLIVSSLISMIGVLRTSYDHPAEKLQGVISCGTTLMICF